jgi:ubiquinone/menaquinone biosynthesis C-methylase UbiE
MAVHTTYTTKAENYARYRWDYEPRAIEAVFSIAALTVDSIVADIGAGTGILTCHFIGRVGLVYAIEPDAGMLREAAQRLPVGPHARHHCTLLDAAAECLPLPDHSVDLVTVAQAIHWFNPEPTRQEFARILKPGGWLALLRNYPLASEIGSAINAILTPENGVCAEKGSPPAYKRPDGFYFSSQGFQKLVFPFTYTQGWEAFLGSMCSASFMPDEDHPAYPRIVHAARDVFECFSQNGQVPGSAETELLIGRISP